MTPAAAPLSMTLVVITRNEASMIATCLDSVPFVAEKLIVDCGSSDDTVATAARHGARVVHQPWLGFGPQRNFASSLAAYDWILVLDADEMLTPALTSELVQRLPSLMNSNSAGAVLRRSTLYMGRPMRWYRPMTGERVARIYHRQRARWTDTHVHESLRFDGPVAAFKHPFLHRHNPTLVHKHFKMLRYTELRAADWIGRGRPPRLWLCPFVFITTFFKDYFLRMAFLDGARGFIAAQTAAAYAVYKRMRYFEIHSHPDSQSLAQDLLRSHGLEP